MNTAADAKVANCVRLTACSLCLASLAGIAPDGHGYTTLTHAAVTSYAARQSQITADPLRSPLFRKLGLTEIVAKYSAHPFLKPAPGDYVAQTNDPIWLDADASFERDILAKLREELGSEVIPHDSSIIGWMMRGSIREDDNPKETPFSDEPGGVFTRVYGHFYDPQNDKGLFVGIRATEWALDPGAIMPLAGQPNLYGVPRMTEAIWRALTGTTAAGQSARPANSGFAKDSDVRKGYWATVFRSLGDAVHMVQDMAQPQHTRNDAHSGYGCLFQQSGCMAGHDSFYEKYVAARALRRDGFRLSEGRLTLNEGELIRVKPSELKYGPYDTPRFNRYADFFSTGSGSNANAAGRGLANYSNRGFYSAGTNVRTSLAFLGYPSPDPSGQSLGREVVIGNGLPDSLLVDFAGKPLIGKATFLTGDVQDNLRGSPDRNIRLSTLGLWDQFLNPQLLMPRYTLTHYNYTAMADLLIPRAVAYSAGLIDFFFRGEMQVTLPDEGVYGVVDHSAVRILDPNLGYAGFNKIKAKIANVTPNGEPMSNGKFVAVLKFHRNRCYQDDLSGYPPFVDWEQCRYEDEEIVVSNAVPLANGSTLSSLPRPVEFTFAQALPLNAT
jgi:hypothetical protein